MRAEFLIVDQSHEWVFDANGRRSGQWTITFQTPSGVQSEILVPDNQYHPAYVSRVLADETTRIEQIAHIQHGETGPLPPGAPASA